MSAAPAAGLVGRLRGAGGRGMGRRAGWSSAVEILQLCSSVLVFLILANLMDEEEYGVMGAVLATALSVSTFCGFGANILLIKRVAQGRDLVAAWRSATSVGIIGTTVGAAVLVAVKPIWLPSVDTSVYVLLLISQLNFFWLTELTVYVGNATTRLKEAAIIRLVVVVCRFAALMWFALLSDGTLEEWAVASFVSFGISAVLALWYVWRVFGAPPSLFGGTWTDVREGMPFAVNGVTEGLVTVSDQPLLVRFGHTADAGVYALGVRIIQFGFMPLRILMRATDADLFAAGQGGVRPALRLTLKLLKPGLAVAVVVGLGAALCAPLVPLLVGDKFDQAVTTIRFLAVLPAIRSIQWLMGNCLSASNLQHLRLRATATAAALNFGLNLIFLPGGDWHTAVYTTLVTEVYLTVLFVGLALFHANREVVTHEVPAPQVPS